MLANRCVIITKGCHAASSFIALTTTQPHQHPRPVLAHNKAQRACFHWSIVSVVSLSVPTLSVSCRGEVWSLDVDPAERRVATGSADNELRLYSVIDAGDEGTHVTSVEGWPSIMSTSRLGSVYSTGPVEDMLCHVELSLARRGHGMLRMLVRGRCRLGSGAGQGVGAARRCAAIGAGAGGCGAVGPLGRRAGLPKRWPQHRAFPVSHLRVCQPTRQ
jgi:hypothetical protein